MFHSVKSHCWLLVILCLTSEYRLVSGSDFFADFSNKGGSATQRRIGGTCCWGGVMTLCPVKKWLPLDFLCLLLCWNIWFLLEAEILGLYVFPCFLHLFASRPHHWCPAVWQQSTLREREDDGFIDFIALSVVFSYVFFGSYSGSPALQSVLVFSAGFLWLCPRSAVLLCCCAMLCWRVREWICHGASMGKSFFCARWA